MMTASLVIAIVMLVVVSIDRVRVTAWWDKRKRAEQYRRRERAALPDGTLVRLLCGAGCGHKDHAGVWATSWSPRRTGFRDDPDDYRLERVGDGETTYAHRNAIEVVATPLPAKVDLRSTSA